MSTEITAGANEPRPEISPSGKSPSGKSSSGGNGFFSLYKPGQGYWTRLGTALGAGAVILFMAWYLFRESSRFVEGTGPRYGIAAGVVAAGSLLAWWLMNAPRRAQFLIDTDSEMKKVNWAGWSELIGSTRIVIFFMLLTALTLFTFDTQFHAFFFGLGVWHIPFDSHMGQATGALLGLVLLAIGVALLRGVETKRGKIAAVVTTAAALAVLGAWVVFTIVHSPAATAVTAAK